MLAGCARLAVMTTESADPLPKRRRPAHRATSEELVQAAKRVIAREGVAATTTRKIAEEASVPLGAVHYWFTDKSELLEDVLRAELSRLEQAISSTGLAHGGSPEDVREAFRAAWGEVTADDPGAQLGLYELTALSLRTPAMRELARRQYASYRELAARVLAPALAGLDPRRAALLAEFVAVTTDGLELAWLADPDGTHPAEMLDLLAEFLGQNHPHHDGEAPA